MGYLTEQLSNEFSRLTRQRGRSYFLRAAVRNLSGDDQQVIATVHGTQPYRIAINITDGLIDYSCTCPVFTRDGQSCKHIWATLLAAEYKELLSDILLQEPADPTASHLKPIAENGPGIFSGQRTGTSGWKQQMAYLRRVMDRERPTKNGATATQREFYYLIDIGKSEDGGKLVIEVGRRDRKINGDWGKLKLQRLYYSEIQQVDNVQDQQILAIIFGAQGESADDFNYTTVAPFFSPRAPLWSVLLPMMCATGRCVLRQDHTVDIEHPLKWDDGEAWDFGLTLAPAGNHQLYQITGTLTRGQESMAIQEPTLLVPGGLVIFGDRIAQLHDHDAFDWVPLLRQNGPVQFAQSESEALLDELLRFPHQPRLTLPPELEFDVVQQTPQPHLTITKGEPRPWGEVRLVCQLSFDYDGVRVAAEQPGRSIYVSENRRAITRDLTAEAAAKQELRRVGLRSDYWSSGAIELLPVQLPSVIENFTRAGWQVDAEGSLYRIGGSMSLEVHSNVDWFELKGAAQFGDAKVALPRLLRAIKQGEQTVRLDDGSFGVIPQEWTGKYGLLAGLGSGDSKALRFSRPQVGLLDALLDSEASISTDEIFDKARKELHRFAGIEESNPSGVFHGELRGYQREGLGWLNFLQRFGFGGCLADDMGLGKTIQVLALLEAQREKHAGGADKKPSLVVVPRSLVFHWRDEAARFTPQLQILDHTGVGRTKPGDHFNDYDIVLTTYGTLRSDATHLKNIHFHYCILDEAQAVKNARTLTAKAVRLLKANHRIAMSGTPVENHLGELWSLFEFLNPGMLGGGTVFSKIGRKPDPQVRDVLKTALRPFILRRTKANVAKELPEKTEQTLFCDLEGKEKKYYDELRDYYRAQLLKGHTAANSGHFKIQVLEALLRLRQAACHPGLIDKSKLAEKSAKIETLLAQLDQVLEEDHKVLVFSQFTSLLAILRRHLDAEKTAYAYLDGRTRDRQSPVERFQNDPKLKLFLISLKAGGQGLNLQAAEYVYLLDPWWNPAVEAQAIDRAHRIGQTRQVFAYRLIARDTVEEKVLALQQSKRDLADAIITADNSVMRNLTREDLELLLS